MGPLAVALVIRNSVVRSEINAALPGFPFRVVVDFQGSTDRETIIRQLKNRRPDMVFVDVSEDSQASLLLLARIRAEDPNQILVALDTTPSVNLVVEALRAGAHEFLHSPIPHHLADISKRWQAAVHARARGRAIGVVSAKGGCGATTIACHSALAIAKRQSGEQRNLLMDLDVSTGLVRFLMKSQSEYSVLDAVKNLHRLDLSYWNALACSKHPGLDVVSAPDNMASDERLDGNEVRTLLSWTRRYYDWIIVDFGRGLGQIATATLPEISQLYVVATHEISSLHVTRNVLRSLELCGYPLSQVRLVINRVPATGRATSREIESAVGAPVFATLANDYASLSECYSTGRLLPNRGKLARGLQSLAAAMTGEKAAPKPTLASRIATRLLIRMARPADLPRVTPPDTYVWQERGGGAAIVSPPAIEKSAHPLLEAPLNS